MNYDAAYEHHWVQGSGTCLLAHLIKLDLFISRLSKECWLIICWIKLILSATHLRGFALFKSICSVQSTTTAACGGLTVLTGHMKASGSQLRLWLQGEWLSAGLLRSNDIHIHPTGLKQWCFIICKPLCTCTRGLDDEEWCISLTWNGAATINWLVDWKLFLIIDEVIPQAKNVKHDLVPVS